MQPTAQRERGRSAVRGPRTAARERKRRWSSWDVLVPLAADCGIATAVPSRALQCSATRMQY